MAYSGEILRRARARLAAQKAENEQAEAARIAEVYEKYPRLREIDHAMRATMARVVAASFRRGEDPTAAVEQAKQENLKLQQERSWILEAADLGEDYLDPVPVCPECGGSGYIGARMCACLASLCRDEQRKALSSLLHGSESFDNFRLDLYPDTPDARLGASPRRIMGIVLHQCRNYAAQFGPQSGSLLFSGDPGLGKTYLSACIARAVIARGASVVYETAVTVFSDFENEKFGRPGGGTEKYLACDLLIRRSIPF